MEFGSEALVREYEKFSNFLLSAHEIPKRREDVRSRMAPTPRDVLYHEHSLTVYRYRREDPPTLATPMLIVPSLVNKPSIMDLLEGESFVQAMLDRGHAVYILEWGIPNPGQKSLTLQHYLEHYLGRAVRRVVKDCPAAGLNLAGYCLGGTMSTLYTALGVGPVKNLVTMVTPVNFEDRGMLSWWARKEHFDVETVVRTFGNVPAQFFSSVFPWLVPTASLKKIRTIYEKQDDPEFLESFLALDLWITENVPFPGGVYRDVIQRGYQENSLIKEGGWDLGTRTARLKDIRVPVLNITAKYDHVSPVESCNVLTDLVGSSDATTLVQDTGHLGPALGKNKTGEHTEECWDQIHQWLEKRDA